MKGSFHPKGEESGFQTLRTKDPLVLSSFFFTHLSTASDIDPSILENRSLGYSSEPLEIRSGKVGAWGTLSLGQHNGLTHLAIA